MNKIVVTYGNKSTNMQIEEVGIQQRIDVEILVIWDSPVATFRWDETADVDFRDLSVR